MKRRNFLKALIAAPVAAVAAKRVVPYAPDEIKFIPIEKITSSIEATNVLWGSKALTSTVWEPKGITVSLSAPVSGSVIIREWHPNKVEWWD